MSAEAKMEKYLKGSMSYSEYIELIDDLLLEHKTTGTNQSAAMFNYAKLNRQRMHRLEKTLKLNENVITAIENAKRQVIWLILTEGWCGDAAQNIPIIEKIAAQSVNITTRYILRDENLDLMDQFLSNGAGSIPKLIALNAETLEVIGSWGSRPRPAQKLFSELKEKGIEKPLIMEDLQRWYNADKGQAIQSELAEFIEQGEGKQVSEVRI